MTTRSIAAALCSALLSLNLPTATSACICVNERVTVMQVKGRVFSIDESAVPAAMSGAMVKLHRTRDHAKVGSTMADTDGMFELETPPPGEYSLEVSVSGFQKTVIPLRMKKGAPDVNKILLVRVDMPGDCTCGDACVDKADRRGLEPKCLLNRWTSRGRLAQ